jgi:hypothetical protein
VAIEARFQSQKGRAEALRDGVSFITNTEIRLSLTIFKLFNASAVVESRLSTRLAQNVKLLICEHLLSFISFLRSKFFYSY